MRKIWKKSLAIVATSILAVSMLAGCGGNKSNVDKDGVTTVKVGVVGEYNDQWDTINQLLEKDKIKVELVKFSDYAIPNRALNDGEIDLNAFQHKAFLENDIKQKGYQLESIGDTVIAPLSIYNNKDKVSSVEEIKDGDIILWMNFRSDRAKQILRALTKEDFEEFPTYKFQNLKVYSFFPIDKDIKTNNFLEDINVTNPLGIYLSTLGITQARIAETEKYAHVTYFFDGMYNGKIDKCEKILIPSPKVETYDLKPEMSAIEVTKKAIHSMEKDTDFIFMNFANPDMVGHTGNLEATIKAVTTVDVCLERLYEVAEDNFYTMIILADHGNADIMLDEFNNPVTTHTTSKVPFIITDLNVELKKSGDLTNVAPTILEYMDIALPEEMANTPSLLIQK